MTKYTPGPWRAEASGFGQVGGFTISDEKNGFGLCQRAPWPSRAEESAANARLIAAAPEMASDLYDGFRAARAVVAAWEAGNLAAAVNALEAWADDAEDTYNRATKARGE